MKKGWNLIVLGLILVIMCPTLMRGVIVLKSKYDSIGQPITIKGQLAHQEDPIGTFMVNWDAYLCLLVGITCVVTGLIINHKKKTFNAEQKASA
jgi:hypothetical protein